MVRERIFDDELEFDDDEDEEFDPEEDAMPISQFVIRREVKKPDHVMIEATIGAESTFIKFWLAHQDDSFNFCFLDTIEPDMVLNALEQKFEAGLLQEVIAFFDTYGKYLKDPVNFRIKLDAIVKASIDIDDDDL